jgi:hypothetical protein
MMARIATSQPNEAMAHITNGEKRNFARPKPFF